MSAAEGVDTEIQIEAEGALYICRSCIADLARTAGFDLQDRTEEITQLSARLEAAEADRNQAEALIIEMEKRGAEIKTKRMERARAAKAEKRETVAANAAGEHAVVGA